MTLVVQVDGLTVPDASNVTIRSVSPGGFSAVTFNLPRKLDESLLPTFTDVMVFDASTGEQVGGGRLLEQGRNDDGSWAVTALGEGLASMQDRTEPYMLVDSSLSSWEVANQTTTRLQGSVSQRPNTEIDAFVISVQSGNWTAANNISVWNRSAYLCGQRIGGYGFTHKEGETNTDRTVHLRTAVYGGSAVSREVDTWSTTNELSRVAVGIDWATLDDVAVIWAATSTGFTPTDNSWISIEIPYLLAQRYAKDGSTITGAVYGNDYVKLEEAIADLLVRFCPRLDAAGATIATGSIQYDQLCWTDGINPMGVMDELFKFESAFAWHVWEKQSNGLWNFELVEHSTEVRYEADTDGGFTSPSPSSEIYDYVRVLWKDKGGRSQVTRRSQTGTALDDVGFHRSATIDLGSEVGTSAQAIQRGDEFLAEHKTPPNAGTITINRPILDNETGRYVQPWNIRPGGLIRVRGVQPTPDTLNATSPDGVTVFRIVSMEFNDDDGTAKLELDVPELTESRALTDLLRYRNRPQSPFRRA